MTRAVLPTLPGTLRRVGRSQARNVFHALRGEPVMTPPLDSATLDQDDVEIAQSWLRNRSCWSDRHVVAQYEGEFARWNGSRYAFAFASGRVALSACIDAMAFQPGDEVILPGYTCFPVPNALCYANLVPVYCDIELGTYGLDVSAVRRKITKRTRAIVLQHLYGLVSRDYDAILELALQCDLRVIEDCAHATGAEYRGVKAGTRGHVGFYSSHQSKIFNTSQGGIAVTNEPDIARRLQACYERAPETSPEQTEGLLRNVLLNYYELKHPQRWWRGDLVAALHGHERLKGASPGEERGVRPAHYGERMSAPIAALGLNQLGKIDAYNRRRRETAVKWDEWCDSHGYERPLVVEGSSPVYLRYPVLVEARRKQARRWAFEEMGINLGTWFEAPPVGAAINDCTSAAVAYERCVNLPSILDDKSRPA